MFFIPSSSVIKPEPVLKPKKILLQNVLVIIMVIIATSIYHNLETC